MARKPAEAYGPNGELIALSYDGGENWSQVPQRPKPEPKPEYKNSIVAVYPDEPGMSRYFTRRIGASFAPLRDSSILPGWANLTEFLKSKAKPDAIVVSLNPEATEIGLRDSIGEIRKRGRLVIDLDPFYVPEDVTGLGELLTQADAVTVATELMAMRLRQFNPNIYVVPSAIDAESWPHKRRTKREKTVFAVQPTNDRFVNETMEWLQEKWGDRIEVVEDLVEHRHPHDDPDFYAGVDVVVVGPPQNMARTGNGVILPAMYAACAVVAEVSYHRTILSGHSGVLVAKKGPTMWRQETSRMVSDSRHRLKMAKGAKTRSEAFTARAMLGRLSLPYRVMFR